MKTQSPGLRWGVFHLPLRPVPSSSLQPPTPSAALQRLQEHTSHFPGLSDPSDKGQEMGTELTQFAAGSVVGVSSSQAFWISQAINSSLVSSNREQSRADGAGEETHGQSNASAIHAGALGRAHAGMWTQRGQGFIEKADNGSTSYV